MYLARNITVGNWKDRSHRLGDIAFEHAINSDLVVRDGTLSFWRCPSDNPADLDAVALALAAARDRVSRVQLVLVQQDRVAALRIRQTATLGRTPVHDLRHLHVTLEEINDVRRQGLAELVQDAVSNGMFRSYSKGEIRSLLLDALGDGRIALEELALSLLARLEASVPRRD